MNYRCQIGRQRLRNGYFGELTMAKNKGDNTGKPSGAKGGGIVGLLTKIFGVLAVFSVTVLFVAALDIGHLGLAKTMSTLATIPLAIYFIGAMMMMFMGGGSSAPQEMPDVDELAAKIDDIQSKTASHIASFQNTIDAMSGQDRDSLMAENKALKEELEAIREAERQKAEDEFNSLRSKNEQLEQQIKEWAIKTVASSVEDRRDDDQAQEAA